MITILLVLAALIVLLQAGLMATLRKLVQQLDQARERIATLESRLEANGPSRAAVGAVPEPEPEPIAFHAPSVGRPVAPVKAEREPDSGFAPDFDPVPAPAPTRPRPQTRKVVPQRNQEPSLFDASDANPDARALRAEMISLMRQLVDQGLSVRDIAARCGLSEAEAELMLSLQSSHA